MRWESMFETNKPPVNLIVLTVGSGLRYPFVLKQCSLARISTPILKTTAYNSNRLHETSEAETGTQNLPSEIGISRQHKMVKPKSSSQDWKLISTTKSGKCTSEAFVSGETVCLWLNKDQIHNTINWTNHHDINMIINIIERHTPHFRPHSSEH